MVLASAASCALLLAGASQDAPELVGSPESWINSKPLTLRGLRGKVVLIDFWEYTCVNCVRSFPYLLEWQRRYQRYGFQVVGIHTPEFEFGKQRSNIVAAAKRFGFAFPIVLDNDKRMYEAFRVEGWPTKILIDKDGKPVYRTLGEYDYVPMEQRIQREVKKLHPSATLPPIMAPVHSADQPGAVCYGRTDELFAGKRGVRDNQFGNGPVKVGTAKVFKFPAERGRSRMFLDGWWSIGPESSVGKAGSKLSINYAGVEVNSVLRATRPVRVEVLHDGKALDKGSLGDDVRMIGGRAVMTVNDAKMYSIVKNPKWGRHEVELRALDPGLTVYAFTFTTECAYRNEL